MNETVSEWLAKANADSQTATRELRAGGFDSACFHAQQCVEKLMKGALIHHGVLPPRTHNLVELDALLRQTRPDWFCNLDELRFLGLGAVEFRYPGSAADSEIASTAVAICGRLSEALRKIVDTKP